MDLYTFLEDRSTGILHDALEALRRAHLQHYEKSGPDQTHQRLRALFVLTARAVKERNLGPMTAHAETIARERFASGFDLAEVQTAFNVLEEIIWQRLLRDAPPADLAEALGLVSTVIGTGKDTLARVYVSLASKSKAPSLDLHSLFTGGG
jgi:hypothetical protein